MINVSLQIPSSSSNRNSLTSSYQNKILVSAILIKKWQAPWCQLVAKQESTHNLFFWHLCTSLQSFHIVGVGVWVPGIHRSEAKRERDAQNQTHNQEYIKVSTSSSFWSQCGMRGKSRANKWQLNYGQRWVFIFKYCENFNYSILWTCSHVCWKNY